MTREDAIKILKSKMDGHTDTSYEWTETVRIAIQALEQEPCDDAVSRQAVNDLVDELARVISDERCCMSRGRSTATIMQDILDLSSVTPQQKYEDIVKAFQLGLAFGFGTKHDEMDRVVNEIKKVIRPEADKEEVQE